MAPRAYWKGYLRLSLVTCPIALYPASTSAEKKRISTRSTRITAIAFVRSLSMKSPVGKSIRKVVLAVMPAHKQDAEGTVKRIGEVLDKPGVRKAVARLRGEGAELKMVWWPSLHSRDN